MEHERVVAVVRGLAPAPASVAAVALGLGQGFRKPAHAARTGFGVGLGREGCGGGGDAGLERGGVARVGGLARRLNLHLRVRLQMLHLHLLDLHMMDLRLAPAATQAGHALHPARTAGTGTRGCTRPWPWHTRRSHCGCRSHRLRSRCQRRCRSQLQHWRTGRGQSPSRLRSRCRCRCRSRCCCCCPSCCPVAALSARAAVGDAGVTAPAAGAPQVPSLNVGPLRRARTARPRAFVAAAPAWASATLRAPLPIDTCPSTGGTQLVLPLQTPPLKLYAPLAVPLALLLSLPLPPLLAPFPITCRAGLVGGGR